MQNHNKKRKLLAHFNYVLLAVLLLVAGMTMMQYENPEHLIEGEWKEEGWYFEKVEESPIYSKHSVIHEEFRKQALEHVPPLNNGKWHFVRDRKQNYIAYHDTVKYDWHVKGRGHILELRNNDELIESFVIEDITEDRMVLYLNIDLQTKGIAKIVLRRDDINKYAKKI